MKGEYLIPSPAPSHLTRERWRSERESLLAEYRQLEGQHKTAEAENKLLETENNILKAHVQSLQELLADREAEIIRLNTLLESQAHRKK